MTGMCRESFLLSAGHSLQKRLGDSEMFGTAGHFYLHILERHDVIGANS